MQDLQREILNQVASGQISAGEGAARLEALAAEPPAAPATATATAAPPVAGRAVKVLTRFGSVEIVGDPSVSFAVAEGAHRARQDGDTLVIEHSLFGTDDSFTFGGMRRAVVGATSQRDDLIVRMNPDLALTASVQAGTLKIEGVHGAISGDVQAGNCSVRDFRGPINLVVQAGDLEATGRLDSGSSKCRCAMGSIRLDLEKGSSVSISARSKMGQIEIDGATRPGNDGRRAIVGDGKATLDIECTLGDVRVNAL